VALAILLSAQFVAAPASHAASNASSTNSATSAPSSRGGTIVSIAMQYRGAPYRFGGASPRGFDCSGFVYYVLNKAGISIGRTIPYQINAGPRVSRSNLQPGDLVFFANTYKSGLSHAGIYIGGGKFINAANESVGVVVSDLGSSYWSSHYSMAVRP
jgi:peptidoglycan DL-endopeptidase CwlO